MKNININHDLGLVDANGNFIHPMQHTQYMSDCGMLILTFTLLLLLFCISAHILRR